MNIKLDENMPRGLAETLQKLHHQVETVPDEGLAGHNDTDIWRSAQTEKRFLITQDLDFADIAKYKPGSHYGIMLVRLKTPGRRALVKRVQEVFECEDSTEWHGCFIVLTDRKLRMHRSEHPG